MTSSIVSQSDPLTRIALVCQQVRLETEQERHHRGLAFRAATAMLSPALELEPFCSTPDMLQERRLRPRLRLIIGGRSERESDDGSPMDIAASCERIIDCLGVTRQS